MPEDWGKSLNASLLADRDFRKLSAFIYENWGINLPASKKTMLSSRLRRRVKACGLGSFKSYIDFVLSEEGEEREWGHLIDAVSTNKTNFFRERQHFDYMSRTLLPRLYYEQRSKNNANLRVWSAGCSSGEEPYTLSIVLAEYEKLNPWFSYSIIATDINSQVLSRARQGIYEDELLETVPKNLKFKYFMRGKGQRSGLHRVVPELRQKITFQRLNLMDKKFNFKIDFDIIFCRNVIIYFDRQTQIKLFQKFHNNLRPDGFLFLGHAENLQGMEKKFVKIESSVYQCKK